MLREIEAFLRETGMPASTFGRRTRNDSALVWELRYKDRQLRESTKEKIRKFMTEYRDAGHLEYKP